ncbi:pirin family protein [Jeongeupia naejangsanensis]|uniref:Pirin family protein n=1 Tax=Jeongeupia naejangsanensis TaxID=613195 RepID=A0ABS2BPH0_9NEIS|nr:pirin family protein [Jeongeupia naejangsanensis]MBM3116948.1 pirin family protein [Jeongeupia naejangsanensis]
MIKLRKAGERGHANHGWLDSWHSFSFAGYYDPAHVQFGALRVINDDRVAPGMGFGTHPHSDMEIISYVLEGELEHKDSMGNGSVIRPGSVQRMSAGTGVLHSEFNPSKQNAAHFLQIWVIPDRKGVKPSYEETHFGDDEKRGRLRLVASADGADGSVTIHQDLRLYSGLFDGEETATQPIAAGRRAYVHVARGNAEVNGIALETGDALMLSDETSVTVAAGKQAEVLVFDLA